jgi:hypothetical protein
VNRRRAGVREEFALYTAFFPPAIPAILNPGPGFIININKILIIEVDFWEIVPYHQCSL